METKKENYIGKKIIKLYDEKVLSKELGEGNLKKRLLNGLEKVLKGHNFPDKNEFPTLYSKRLDYNSMRKIAEELYPNQETSHLISRLKIQLGHMKIGTYGDLKEIQNSNDYFHKGIKIRKSQIGNGFCMRNIGKKTARILWEHLEQIGIVETGQL